MSVSIEAIVPRIPEKQPALRSLFLDLQDSLFGALTELLHGRDRLELAGRFDDQERAIERVVFGEMRQCHCHCCGRHLPRLLRADAYDHRERHDGWEIKAARDEAVAGELRGASTRIEAGRLAAIGSRQMERFGLVGR